jgi:hypothetical protein
MSTSRKTAQNERITTTRNQTKNNRTESKQEHLHAHETATSAPDLNKNIHTASKQ